MFTKLVFERQFGVFFSLTIVATVTIAKIVCYIPGFVLKLLHALFHLIIPETLGDSYYDNLYFKKIQKLGQVMAQG